MSNEELVAANEALAALLKEAIADLEHVKAERDAVATSAQALALKLAGEKLKASEEDPVHVLVMAESELEEIWNQLDSDFRPYYQDNGPSDLKKRWQFEIWDWNIKTHIITWAPSKEILQQWEPALMRAYHAGMYSLWRYATKRMWGD